MPGYLTLHQTATTLTIKWTPNQLMNNNTDDEPIDKKLDFYGVYLKVLYL